jgi:kinesin family member 6/9
MIQNDMKKNEQVDAGVVITRLKKEVKELNAELNLLKGGKQKDYLTQEDIERCNAMVNNFIKSDDPAASLVLPDRLMINHCFYYFRTLYQGAVKKQGGQLAIKAEDKSPTKVED